MDAKTVENTDVGTVIPLYIVNQKVKAMLRWTLIFLVIAIVAGILGFTGIASGAASIAKIIFFVFLVLVVGSFLLGASIFRRH